VVAEPVTSACAIDTSRSLGGDWLTHASEIVVDWQTGHVDPAATAKVVARFLVASEQTERGEADLVALITRGAAGQ